MWALVPLGVGALSLLLLRHSSAVRTGAFLAGTVYAMWVGHGYLAQQLSLELSQKEFRVNGKVVGLPSHDEQKVRFLIDVHHVETLDQSSPSDHDFPSKLQISWYDYKRANTQTMPRPGEYWQMDVRLKTPRGFVNKEGFDYQAWLIRRGIGATGYVLRSTVPQKIARATANDPYTVISRARYSLREWVMSVTNSSVAPVLVALLIGDSSGLTPDIWEPMRQSGTSHLIAISGLHVGFVSLFGVWIGNLLGRVIQLRIHAIPACVVGWSSGLLCALIYSALAGFNIPTVRTLIMLGLFYGACLLRLHLSIWTIYVTALAIVCVIDPLAAFDMGFWLSFGAVAILLVVFAGHYGPPSIGNQVSRFQWRQLLRDFVRSQWVMLIGLALPLSVLVGSISLIAPLANAIAIPVVTFVVVPSLLISAALAYLAPVVAAWLVHFADAVMTLLVDGLVVVLALSGYVANPVFSLPKGFLPLATITVAMWLLPKALVPRGLAALCVGITTMLVIWGRASTVSPLVVDILDVGQGTAVIVSTPNHHLVYDVGPRFTEEFDAGGAVAAPALFSRGIANIDRLILSHKDNDHTGGLQGFLQKVGVKDVHAGDVEGVSGLMNALTVYPRRLYAGISPQDLRRHSISDCHTEAPWIWDGVEFSYVSSAPNVQRASNDKSCVLLIKYGDSQVLLTGDMTKTVEQELLARNLVPSNITLLLAGHHGSNTSSGYSWVTITNPQYVVYSAAFQSRYGHPHPSVVKRFEQAGSQAYHTATHGQIRFTWDYQGSLTIEPQRQSKKRYWYQ